MLHIQKWIAVCLLLAMCLPLWACQQPEEAASTTTLATEQVHLPVSGANSDPYWTFSADELLPMMCECKCGMLQQLAADSSAEKYTISGVAERMAECPAAAAFLNHPNSMRLLQNSGMDTYQAYVESEEDALRLAAEGLKVILTVFCPNLLEE